MNKSNYEIIMENMTPEKMAEFGVKLVNVNNRQLFYLTSSGQLFMMDSYDAALNHEYMWLMHKEGDSNDSENPPLNNDKNKEEIIDNE